MRTINCNHNMSETWQSFCDFMYSNFSKMNDFIIEVDCLVDGRKEFYFHKPEVTEYKVSVFRSAFHAYPEEFTIVSDSGLELKYNQYGVKITNTRRFEPSRSTKKHQYFCVKRLVSFA